MWIVDDEADIVRQIFNLTFEGFGPYQTTEILELSVSDEEISAELNRRAGEEISPERVEQLLCEIVASDTIEKLLSSGCSQIAAQINEDSNFEELPRYALVSAEQRALLSAVIYARARNGRLSGIPSDTDPGVIAVFVNANVERAGIIARLANGEIDEKEASSLLSIVGSVVKFMLSTAILIVMAASVGAIAVEEAAALVGSAAFGAAAISTVGFLTCFGVVFGLNDAVEEVVDTVCRVVYKTVKSAAKVVVHFFRQRKGIKTCVFTQ